MDTTGLRRRAIVAASALPLRPRDPGPVGVPDGPVLTVVAANLCRSEREAEAQARAMLAVDADVLLLTEATEVTEAALVGAGLDATHPHTSFDADDGYFGSIVASRHPVTARWTGDVGGRRGHRVELDVAGVGLRVVPVHTQAPIYDRDVDVWHATIEANAALADGADGPVVLAGDWNATGGHRRLRRAVEGHGLVDAQVRAGRRWFPTWPVEAHPLMWVPVAPVLTLDHVVVSADVAVVGLERLALPATDHLALRAALRLPSVHPRG